MSLMIYLPVDRGGLRKLADLEAAITDQTALVSQSAGFADGLTVI